MKLPRLRLIPFATAVLAISATASAAEPAGDLGLDQPRSSVNSNNIGIGLNTTLSTGVSAGANTAAVQAFSLRIWLGQLEIEPLFGIGISSGANGGSATVGFTTGALVGYALKMGNLRPIIGGGLTFGLLSAGATRAGMTFGPMFAIEYRFTELPNLGLEAALFIPFGMVFDPFVFSFGTHGNVIAGFHYYF